MLENLKSELQDDINIDVKVDCNIEFAFGIEIVPETFKIKVNINVKVIVEVITV